MSSSADLDELVALSRHRWAAALIADLAAHEGARFVELLHRIGLSRDSLARTIDAARQSGWVAPNPGHGHPLRPEYVLTAEGQRLALRASRIVAAQRRIHLGPDQLTRWSLPIVRVLDGGNSRFNAVARLLAPASPRALSQSLRSLAANRLVDRVLADGYPPASSYRLTDHGRILADAV